MNSIAHLQKQEYGTSGFPVKYSFISPEVPDQNMAVHWHKEWEIIRVIDGSFNLQIDTRESILKAGDFVLLNGSALHTGVSDNCTYECLVFDIHELFRTSEIIKKHLRPVYKLEILPLTHYSKGKNPELFSIVEKLMTSASEYSPDNSDSKELTVVALLCIFFATLLENKSYILNPDKSITHSPKIGQIKLAIEYIENHFRETISLTDISRVAGMSPKYFCKIFKAVTHKTPVDYVILYRIEQACILLSTTNTPIIDIAMECGFNDCSYFIRTFKKFKGKTPTQYRNS